MLLRHKFQAFALLLITITSCNAQLWVGSDSFSSSSIDSNKWGETKQFYSDYQYNDVSLAVDSGKLAFRGSGGNNFLKYKNEISVSDSWFTSVDASISPIVLNGSFTYSRAAIFLSLAGRPTGSIYGGEQYLGISLVGYGATPGSSYPNTSGANAWEANNKGYSYQGGISAPTLSGFGRVSPLATVDGVFSLGMSFNSNTKQLTTYLDVDGPLNSGAMVVKEVVDLSLWSMAGNEKFQLYIGSLAGTTGSEVLFDNFQIIPEPSAFSLLAIGLGGLAMMRRRRA